MAVMNTDPFAVYNTTSTTPGGEPLAATKRTSWVAVARLTGGYNLSANWAVQANYATYGVGEVEMAFPQYPGHDWGVKGSPPIYQRHVLKFKTSTMALLPTYTHAVGNDSRLIVGAGVCSSSTSSHFEATWMPGGPRAPAEYVLQSGSNAEVKESSLGYIFSLGVNQLITPNLSMEMNFNYTAFKIKVPTSPWATNSKSSINAGSLSAEIALAWHF